MILVIKCQSCRAGCICEFGIIDFTISAPGKFNMMSIMPGIDDPQRPCDEI